MRPDVSFRPYRSRSPVDFVPWCSTDAIRPWVTTIRPSAIPSSGMISAGTELTKEDALAPPSVVQARATSILDLNGFLRTKTLVAARTPNITTQPCVPGMTHSRPNHVPKHHEMLIAGSMPRVNPERFLLSSIDRLGSRRSSFFFNRISSDVKIDITPEAKLLPGAIESCTQCTCAVVFLIQSCLRDIKNESPEKRSMATQTQANATHQVGSIDSPKNRTALRNWPVGAMY